MAYSDKQRAQACKLVEANGGVIDKETLSAVRALLNAPSLPFMTVQRWLNHKNVNVVKEPDRYDTEPLDVLFEGVARTYIRHAETDDAKLRTSGAQAMTAAAIAVDKMRLLQGLPTEIVAIAPTLTKLIQIINERGWKASDVFEDMFQELAGQHADAE
jgi:hypothetical protein